MCFHPETLTQMTDYFLPLERHFLKEMFYFSEDWGSVKTGKDFMLRTQGI